MTQPTVRIDELLTKWGEAYRASLPQRTPEEVEADWQEFDDRFYGRVQERLDAAGVVICCLCHRERPRSSPDEPYWYPAEECENVRKPWHYHRNFQSRKADAREARRHKRRLRRGRVRRQEAPGPAHE
ncbi:hypothetical protein [Actinacidiphila sp. ITFR-21]|uniref:hypothetical protein n=1 Tax=Actinacidiphila sp. ITFR-21 TaxID=3075199 RepID=UPI00288A5E99|nr:hypothetical protein [Streptomyces sp. ITFR-21]WNI17664.1 hypothetical protein RLT57_20455 [Streptomyces sp. ITFR-21]WNI17804.1 hypothetical protein RLT57_21170 [Streptomyces sp. ITFR-21]